MHTIKKSLLAMLLFAFAASLAQAETNTQTTHTDKSFKLVTVVHNHMQSYVNVLPYFLMADHNRGNSTQNGFGFSLGYGHQITGGFYGEAQVFGGGIETGRKSSADFYQYGIGLDLMYRFARDSLISPFVLVGVGGVHDDVVPDSDDSTNFYANAGVGFMTAPLTDTGMRIRAGVRYIDDEFGYHGADRMGDVRVSLGLVFPLGSRHV